MDSHDDLDLNNKGNSSPTKICQYLRFINDPTVRSGYSNPINACHHAKPAQVVSLSHQEEYCLAGKYNECPIYPANWSGSLPKGIRGKVEGTPHPVKNITQLILGASGLLMVLFLFLFLQQSGVFKELISPIPTPDIRGRSWLVSTNTQSITNTNEIIPVQINKMVAQATRNEIIPVTGAIEDFRLGPQKEYLVHTVVEGETESKLAERYGTTINILRQLNLLNDQTKLLPKALLVVIPEKKDANNLKPLQAIKNLSKINLSEAYKKYNVDEKDFKKYNSIKGDSIDADQWILIPKMNPTKTVTITISPTITITKSLTASKTITSTTTKTNTSTFTATATKTNTRTPTPTKTSTLTPSFTPTNTEVSFTPGPGTNKPFGPNNQYLVHLVFGGESIEYLASIFKTSPEVIKKVNYLPNQTTLWTDMVLVIMPGETNVDKVIPMRGIFIDHKVQVIEFLKPYKDSQENFRENNLIDGEWIYPGRWVVVRRME